MESGKEGVWVCVWGLWVVSFLSRRNGECVCMIEVVIVEEREGGEGFGDGR